MVQEGHTCCRWTEGGKAGHRDGMGPGPRQQWWEQRRGVSGASEEGRGAVSGTWRQGSYSQGERAGLHDQVDGGSAPEMGTRGQQVFGACFLDVPEGSWVQAAPGLGTERLAIISV